MLVGDIVSKCDLIAEYARKNNLCMYSVTEYKDGEMKHIVLNGSGCTNVYSVSKAFTMAAIGFLYDEGKIKMTETVGELFGPLPEGSDKKWEKVTVHDLLRHRTGTTSGWVDIDDENSHSARTADWLAPIFAVKIDGVTGETYNYTDDNYYLLSRIVSLKSGMNTNDYLFEKLYLPLGFNDLAWGTCPKGYSVGGSSLYMKSNDVIKLGKLWLDKGMWDGKRIISEEWCRLAVENNYAFSCRSEERQGYYKTGANGQILYFSYYDNEVIAFNTYMNSDDRTVIVDKFFPIELDK